MIHQVVTSAEGWARPGQSREVALDFGGIMKGHMEMR